MTQPTLRTLWTLASVALLGGCADPCYDDGLLQKEGDEAKCAALASGTGTGGATGGMSETATEGQSADGGACDNGVQDGDETDVDCGGSCDSKCGGGDGCGSNGDCESGSCDTDSGTCDGGDGTCSDGVQNQDETDVDCGGMCGSTCEDGEGCNDDEDCVSDFCGDADVCEPNPEWCADNDGDGAGDPDDCVTVGDGDDPPDGFVNNDNDCDDTSEFVFPGAAPNDSKTDCMEDKDEDDWGDDSPAGASTVPGTDCDDDSLTTFPGAAPNDDPRACMKDDDDDDWGDSDPPPGGGTAGSDCDDDDFDVPPSCLTVEVTANPVNIMAGGVSDLLATPMLGDGDYTFAWNPAATLDDTTIAGPDAAPPASTTYDVVVTDGNGDMAAGDVTVHVTDVPVVVDQCEEVDLGIDLDANPTAVWDYSMGGQQSCETANGDPTALVCNVVLDEAMFSAHFEVQEVADDDHLGFMWGVQDAQHFYLLTWKQIGQTFDDCGVDVPTGVTIKVIDADGALQCEDLLDDADTANSTVLALPEDFYDQGWVDNEEYRFELEQTQMGFTVRIIVESDGSVLAEQTFADTTYTSGRFGFYTYSQSSSCFWDVFTAGL